MQEEQKTNGENLKIELEFGTLEFGNERQIALLNMTKQQRQYINGILLGKTKKQSALDAGYSTHVACNPGQIERQIGKERIKEFVENPLTEAFENEGVNAEFIAGIIHELLEGKGWQTKNAGITQWAKLTGSYAPEKVDLNQKTIGNVLDELEEEE